MSSHHGKSFKTSTQFHQKLGSNVTVLKLNLLGLWAKVRGLLFLSIIIYDVSRSMNALDWRPVVEILPSTERPKDYFK